MPQMAPMMWMSLTLFFLLTFIMFSMMIYHNNFLFYMKK
nr:ATP synthase F0 subunit 8 [Stenochironomus gibbus]UKO32971.1 ATP synthase F0 subunit 8 [Stenochironomus gibbus]